MWGRDDDGQARFSRAAELHAGVDEALIQLITYHLLGYEIEFGADAVLKVLSILRIQINRVAAHGGDRLESSYLLNRAFAMYRLNDYKRIPAIVFRVWKNDPSYLKNRGVLSVFFRSMARRLLR